MTNPEYQAEFSLLAGQGYQLIDVDGYTIGGTDRYAASWGRSDAPFTDLPTTGSSIAQLEVMDDQVFCVPGTNADCLLNSVPFGTPDSRLSQINVGHLLDHHAGWDRNISGDPMFQQLQIASDMGIASPPSKNDIARHVLGRPLDFTPGARYEYSNFGYLVLGLIVEQVTGQNYTDYIQGQIFNPIGVADTEIELGRSLETFRNTREPWYSDPYLGTNLFNSSEQVPWPDGAFHIESMDSHGGLIATSDAITSFLDEYWISGLPRGPGSQNWTFFGSLPGTVTMARQRSDGLNIAVLVNQRTDTSNAVYDLGPLRNSLDAVADAINWPVPKVDSVELNDGRSERSQLTSVRLTFDTHVNHAALSAAFSLTNVTTGTPVTSLIVESPVEIGEKTSVVLRFGAGPSVESRSGTEAMQNSLADGHYRLDVDNADVKGAFFGRQLATDYLFGSPDANSIGNDRFFRLFGDSDGDRDVDGQDYGRFGLSFLKTVGMPGFRDSFDSDGDGDVDGLDYGRFGRRFMKSI